jgi:hypothetical protein
MQQHGRGQGRQSTRLGSAQQSAKPGESLQLQQLHLHGREQALLADEGKGLEQT